MPLLEFSSWSIKLNNKRLRLLIVYRPPYSTNHPISTTVFFDEFPKLLEDFTDTNEPILITGDFNIHMEDDSNRDQIRFDDLLQSMGLIPQVTTPTHISGHALDQFIICCNNGIQISNISTDCYISDHCFISADVDFPKPSLEQNMVVFRQYKSIDKSVFRKDLNE